LEVWPAALTAGLSFALTQFILSNFHGPWLVDVVGSLVSMAALVVLLQRWRPKLKGSPAPQTDATRRNARTADGSRAIFRAWVPWILLSAVVFCWGLPQVKALLNSIWNPQFEVPWLHQAVLRAPPVAPIDAKPESAVYSLNVLSATGTGILVAALASGWFMGCTFKEMVRVYAATLHRIRHSLLTITAMLALGYVTRYSGTDATLGLALAATGVWYPFFGTLLGWLGVALTGSDTASNVLFGSLQTITAQQTGINPVLMAAANTTGGVMGKMIDAQSIVVASTATNYYGQEGAILRYVFLHSLILASLVGLLVFLQAYVPPFTYMLIGAP
jgi:lactate permease